jgi:phospholipid/cholesterol/gamma-HCH transport system substrate-binding protein
MQNASKVGFLVVVFVALLYGGYAILGKAFIKEKTKTYYAVFSDAGGTVVGTEVTMAGVKIGTVRKVQLLNARQAKLTFEVRDEVKIPQGSSAHIAGSLIGIGASPIEIQPPARDTSAFLADGDTIEGLRSSPLAELLPGSKETMHELNLTLAATRKLIENKELQGKLEKLIDSSSATLDKFAGLATQAQGLMANTNGLLADNKATLSAAMKNASLAMSDVRKSTQMLTQLIESGKYQKETLTLLKQLNETAKKADDLMVGINQFVTDPKLQADLKETLSSVNKMADSGTRIAANSEVISKNGITMSEKAIELLDKANALADEARSAMEKISGFFNKGPGKPMLPKVEAHLDLLRQSDPSHWRTDMWGRFNLGETFVDAGLYDAFESNKVILQYGDRLIGSAAYRYGIYASKPGLGVDFRVAPKVSLRSDLFDINNPHLDFRTQIDFGKGFVGFFGLENIFDRNSIVAGVGIKR